MSSTRPPTSGARAPASRSQGSLEKPSQRSSGGPWSEAPSRRPARARAPGGGLEGLTGRQWLRVTGVALGGSLLVYAGWNALRDPSPPARSHAAAPGGASTRFADGQDRAPLEGTDDVAPGVMSADAGRSAAPSIQVVPPEAHLAWPAAADPHEPVDAGVARTAPVPEPPLAPTAPAATPAPPVERPAPGALLATAALVPPGAGQAPPPDDTAGDPAARDELGPPIQRHVVQVVVSRWQQPGLCPIGYNVIARNAMLLEFRRLYWDNGASLFLDPQLSNVIQQRLVGQLEAAESIVRAQLQLEPPRPNVFAYADTHRLVAASCANADVVAYYDGAIHLVPSQADVAQSAVHEYTHHALISSGLVGPAWAQEGIAMTVANETWWRQRTWLDRVAEKPFSLESMELAVPYTLSSEQAVLFYVQAAAMVACALQNEEGGLVGLVRSLRHSHAWALDYTLPVLADPRSFRACANELMR